MCRSRVLGDLLAVQRSGSLISCSIFDRILITGKHRHNLGNRSGPASVETDDWAGLARSAPPPAHVEMIRYKYRPSGDFADSVPGKSLLILLE